MMNVLHVRKSSAAVNLLIGVIWLAKPLRDVYMPGFLSIHHSSSADKPDVFVPVVLGALFLLNAFRGFCSIRTNPEGKIPPQVRTLFGPQ